MRQKTRGGDLRVGLGLRREHFDDIERGSSLPDWFEVLSENHFRFGGRARDIVRMVAAAVPVCAHGVSLNIGGPAPLNQEYLDDLARLCELIDPPWVSDHLCFSGAHGYEYQDLIPVPFCDAAVEHVSNRIRQVQDFLGLPFALENPSYYMMMPGTTMPESEFIRKIIEEADCGLLLDVNNVFVNGTNHNYDPWSFIQSLPLDRTLQLHMAGHDVLEDGMLFDTHGQPVPDPVWSLFEQLIQHHGSIPTLIEWDNDLPDFERLMDEARTAQSIMDRALAERETSEPATTRSLDQIEIYGVPIELPLHEFFDAIAPALDGSSDINTVSQTLKLNALGTQRLAFYRQQVHQHAMNIVSMVFPDTLEALGADRFERLALAYTRRHPMNHYEWNETARAFPEFLQKESGEELPAWSHELAQLEWDWFATYTNPAQTTPPNQGLQLNQTLLWSSYSHRVAAWSRATPDERPEAPEQGEEDLIMFRDPKTQSTRIIEPKDRELLALKMVAEGLEIDAVCAATGATPSFLEQIIEEGLQAGFLVQN